MVWNGQEKVWIITRRNRRGSLNKTMCTVMNLPLWRALVRILNKVKTDWFNHCCLEEPIPRLYGSIKFWFCDAGSYTGPWRKLRSQPGMSGEPAESLSTLGNGPSMVGRRQTPSFVSALHASLKTPCSPKPAPSFAFND